MSGVYIRGKRIYINFSLNGVRYREMLDEEPTPENIEYAALLRAKILREIKCGNFEFEKYFPHSPHASSYKKRNPRQTVSAALDILMESIQPLCHKSTLKDYQSSVNAHLKPTFGHFQLCDLRAEDITRWISGLHMTRKRVSNVLVPLRLMIKNACVNRLVDENPFTRVPDLRRFKNLTDSSDENIDPFNFVEIGKILGAMDGQIRNFYQFAFATGMRTSELIALKWSDIDSKNNTIKVQSAYVLQEMKTTKSKSGKRDVDLNSVALSALDDQKKYTLRENDFIFHDPKTNEIWRGDSALRRKAWIPALEKAGIRYRYPYQTRHTWASLALAAGERELYVAKQLGHATVEMVRRHYGKFIKGADVNAGNRIGKVFQEMKMLDDDDYTS